MDDVKVLKEKMNQLRQVKDVVYVNDKTNCSNFLEEIKKMVIENPNNYDLGSAVRKFYFSNFN